MTISTNKARNEYTSTAAQSVFNYTFKIYEDTDLNVFVTPVGQEPDDTTDLTTSYSVSGVGLEAGGAITLNTPANLGDLVTIVSNIPASRTTDYQVNGDFRPPTVNDDFDRVVSLVKQVEEITSRALISQESQQGGGLTFPAPISKQFLRWKTDLSGLENTGALDSESVAVIDVVEKTSSVLDLINSVSQVDEKTYITLGFYAGDSKGSGVFTYRTTVDKATANGGTIIDPDTIGGFDGTVNTLAAYLAAQGTGVGLGCFVSVEPMVVNPAQFGANGNVLVDSIAFNASVDYGRTLVNTADGEGITTNSTAYSFIFKPSPGAYIIDTPINMTGIRQSHSWWYVDMRGVVIFGRCAGKCIFDLLYSRKCAWLGGMFISEVATPCRCAIQIGRNSGLQASDSHFFETPEFKGDFTLGGIYNYASEDVTFLGVAVKNAYPTTSYCVVQDGDHYWGAESDYQVVAPLNTPASFLRNQFIRTDFRKSGPGTAVWMSLAVHHTYADVYVVSEDEAGFVFFANTNNQSNIGIRIDGHIETDFGDLDPGTGNKYGILFDASSPATSVQVEKLKFVDNFVHCSLAVFAHTANVSGVDFKAADCEVGKITRDVGQTLFDIPADYSYSGRLVSFDNTGNYDIVGLSSFTGLFYSILSGSYGLLDTGSFILQDANSMFYKNSVRIIETTAGESSFSAYSSAKALVARIIYNSSVARWQWLIGSTNYMELSATWLRPATDLGISLGQAIRRFVNIYGNTFRPGAGAVGWTSGTGSPEGVLALPVGSLYTDDAGGLGTTLYVKESGAATSTGWVAK